MPPAAVGSQGMASASARVGTSSSRTASRRVALDPCTVDFRASLADAPAGATVPAIRCARGRRRQGGARRRERLNKAHDASGGDGMRLWGRGGPPSARTASS